MKITKEDLILVGSSMAYGFIIVIADKLGGFRGVITASVGLGYVTFLLVVKLLAKKP